MNKLNKTNNIIIIIIFKIIYLIRKQTEKKTS